MGSVVTDPAELVPELGPELGSLAELTREAGDSDPSLQSIRLDLVGHLFERAEAARGFLLTGDRAGAVAALDRPVWLEAWQTAVRTTAERVVEVVTARIAEAGRRSGYPERRLRAAIPSADDRAVLQAKLEAAGIPLESALARAAPGAVWWDEVRRRAAALEESWQGLENVVRLELASADERVEIIERWRPSFAGPIAAAVGLLAALAWLGLVIGGYLPRPEWLDGVSDWFWSLPWP